MKSRTISKHMRCIGQTVTGKPILGGAFFFADTIGLPLEFQILEAEKIGAVVSLPAFVTDAKRAGWSLDTIWQQIREAITILGRFDMVEPLRIAVEATYQDETATLCQICDDRQEGCICCRLLPARKSFRPPTSS